MTLLEVASQLADKTIKSLTQNKPTEKQFEERYPLVSVIIPTYNRPESTIRAIKSVLNQTYKNVEVIIVDDCSTDNTQERLSNIDHEKISIHHHKENRGANAARNTGIKNSHGKYIAFLDSDDKWVPTKLEEQVNLLQSENATAIYCGVRHPFESFFRSLTHRVGSFISSTPNTYPEGGTDLIPLVLSGKFPLGGSSTLVIQRKILDQVGMLDEDFERHQDWEFLIRILKHGRVICVDKDLVLKFDTGSPGYCTQREAKYKLLNKYSEFVIDNELNFGDIIDKNHFQLAKDAIAEREYSIAYQHFRASGTTKPSDLAIILFKFIKTVAISN